jgi:hypothetical protein
MPPRSAAEVAVLASLAAELPELPAGDFELDPQPDKARVAAAETARTETNRRFTNGSILIARTKLVGMVR